MGLSFELDQVIFKESSLPQDTLKSMFHVSYLHWQEKISGIKTRSLFEDCRRGGKLQISLDYVLRGFNHVKKDGVLAGWAVDGLIARPLPNRIRPGNVSSAVRCWPKYAERKHAIAHVDICERTNKGRKCLPMLQGAASAEGEDGREKLKFVGQD